MTRARSITLAFCLAVALLAPRAASAAPITFTLEGTQDSSLSALVELTYTAIDLFRATLTLDITNTSTSGDPRLTSFAFSTPLGVLYVSNFTSEESGWTYRFDPNDINTLGDYGYFDVAGLTGRNFNGGDPQDGIVRGEEQTFTFSLWGLGLNLYTEENFLRMSHDPIGGANESEQYFIARFQQTGPNGQGSDVAIPTGPPSRVPEPTTFMLTGLGAVGFFVRRRAKAA